MDDALLIFANTPLNFENGSKAKQEETAAAACRPARRSNAATTGLAATTRRPTERATGQSNGDFSRSTSECLS